MHLTVTIRFSGNFMYLFSESLKYCLHSSQKLPQLGLPGNIVIYCINKEAQILHHKFAF